MSESKTPPEHPNAQQLLSATKGFDCLFSNDIAAARKHFEPHDDPFHLLGLGVCSFLEAALGMEVFIRLVVCIQNALIDLPVSIDDGGIEVSCSRRSRHTKANENT